MEYGVSVHDMYRQIITHCCLLLNNRGPLYLQFKSNLLFIVNRNISWSICGLGIHYTKNFLPCLFSFTSTSNLIIFGHPDYCMCESAINAKCKMLFELYYRF